MKEKSAREKFDVNLHVLVNKTLKDRIDKYANEQGMEMAVVVRMALKEFLDNAKVK